MPSRIKLIKNPVFLDYYSKVMVILLFVLKYSDISLFLKMKNWFSWPAKIMVSPFKILWFVKEKNCSIISKYQKLLLYTELQGGQCTLFWLDVDKMDVSNTLYQQKNWCHVKCLSCYNIQTSLQATDARYCHINTGTNWSVNRFNSM